MSQRKTNRKQEWMNENKKRRQQLSSLQGEDRHKLKDSPLSQLQRKHQKRERVNMMKNSAHAFLVWLAVYDLLALGPTNNTSVSLLAAAADEDADLGHGDEDDDVGGDHHGDHVEYDPENENPENRCRRNPTWRIQEDDGDGVTLLDYANTCQELNGWEPRDVWWREDPYPAAFWLSDGKEQQIADCLDEAMRNVDGTLWWASCNETNRSDACFVEDPMVASHYAHVEEGDIVMVRNALTEQEAYGVEALVTCMQKLLPNDLPFYEERAFGHVDDEDHGLYSGDGGNFCTFVQGMVQKYLPGVALSMFRAIHVAYEAAEWSGLGIPEPYQLGLRTAEVLQYKKTGRLGLHRDSESLLSISVALSHEDDYEGGFFHLRDENVLFKVPRLGAMVFFSESDHGISPVHGGDRKTFVMELWDEDDVPLGTPRPGPGDFHEYQDVRKAELGIGSNADVPDDDADDEQANDESEAHEEL